jgi:hypothetical protein
MALTYEDFCKFVKSKQCFYCDENLAWMEFSGSGSSPAYNLDRKDNTRGYSKDNCVPCCIDCNRAKGNRYTFEEWTEMVNALKAYRAAQRNFAATV